MMKMRSVAMVLAALGVWSAQAELTTVWGKESTSGGVIQNALSWYEDEACTIPSAITPWTAGSNTCQYVILGAKKFDKGSSFPDLPVYFGRDGVTVGTTVGSRFSFNLNAVALTFPNATLFWGYFMANGTGYTTLKGTYRLVQTSQGIGFAGTNITDGNTRGYVFDCTMSSDADVTATLGMTLGGTGTGHGIMTFKGDFSGYKGKFVVSDVPNKGANTGYMLLTLDSPSALGDTSSPRADAFTIGDRTHLRMTDAVVQDGTRGITLSLKAGQTLYLDAKADTKWTLKTPLTGGAAGTLAKIGPGTVALAGSVETKNLVVTNGTLEVTGTATFGEGSTLTIKNGGRVLSRVGATIPNVTLVVEEGGIFTYDFEVPFDGTVPTPLNFTSLTAADRAALTKPAPIWLSQKIDLPVNASNRLALATFSTAAGFTQEDFVDVTEKSFGYLPTTWFETDEADGVMTLYLAMRPAIVSTDDQHKLGVGANCRPLCTAKTWTKRESNGDYTDLGVDIWSDGQAPHAGADYVFTNGVMATWTGHDNSTRTFPGESLYLTQAISMKSRNLKVKDFYLDGSAALNSINGSPTTHTYSGDTLTFMNKNLTMTDTRETNGNMHNYELAANLAGTGSLKLTSVTNEPSPSYLSGVNSNFLGTVEVTNNKTPDIGQGTIIVFNNQWGFGGALPVFNYSSLCLRRNSRMRPTQTLTLDVPNRGISIEDGGGFDVPEDVVLTVAQTVRLNFGNASSKLLKTGAGVLKIDASMTHGYDGTNCVNGLNNKIQVLEGWLAPSTNHTNGYERANVAFATGTGLAVTPGADDGYGLYVPLEGGLSFADGLLAVRLLDAEAAIASGKSFTVPLCTVTNTTTDLTKKFTFERVAANPNLQATVIREDIPDGLVRYSATWQPGGLMMILR